MYYGVYVENHIFDKTLPLLFIAFIKLFTSTLSRWRHAGMQFSKWDNNVRDFEAYFPGQELKLNP